MAVKPILQALLVAERVFQDGISGQFIIAGVFSHVQVLRKNPGPTQDDDGDSSESETIVRKVMPGGRGAPEAYLRLTAVRGDVPLELRYRHLNTSEVLLRTNFTISNDDPVRSVERVIPLPRLPLPSTGVYALELLHEGEIIGACRITADCGDDSQETETDAPDGDGGGSEHNPEEQ